MTSPSEKIVVQSSTFVSHNIPELTIVDTGSAPPALPSVTDPGVQVWRDHDGTVSAYGHTVSGIHWMHLPGLASFRFGGGTDGVMAIAQPAVREDRILGQYYRSVLPMVLQVRGWEVLHASAVLTSKGVVAMCATSGTGKSTTAVGLSQRGWPLWADDAVAFEALDSGIKTVPLPFNLRLLSDATVFFGQGAKTAGADNSRNGIERIEKEPQQLTALLLLTRAHDGCGDEVVRVRRLSSAETFVGLLTHAYSFNPRDVERRRSMTQHYLDLITLVPTFEVSFQPGLERLPAVLDRMEQLIHHDLEEAP